MAVVKNDVFDNIANVNNQIDRNNFDLSESVNLTTNIGRITPIYTRLMPPNSSMKINVRMALKMMPFAYDLQNQINARISFFKVPLRTLWSDYEDFVSNFRKDLQPPYIDFVNDDRAKTRLAVSSLADYLGVPPYLENYYTITSGYKELTIGVSGNNSITKEPITGISSPETMTYTPGTVINVQSNDGYAYTFKAYQRPRVKLILKDGKYYVRVKTSVAAILAPAGFISFVANQGSVASDFQIVVKGGTIDYVDYEIPDSKRDKLFEYVDDGYLLKENAFIRVGYCANPSVSTEQTINFEQLPYNMPFSVYAVEGGSLQVPFYKSAQPDANQIKLSAYPFRAYESIYNAYYRDMRNNPYYVNGKVEYNKWIPTRDGGADKCDYTLHQCNWERDFLTTAQFTPQQGDPNRPPLVGITTYESVITNEDGSQTIQTHAAITDEDGKKYGLEFTNDEDGLTDVKYTRLADNLAVQGTRSLYDVATSGISIADLRNVNAYQKFLEMNMRKGYSYKDIIEGRFDVKVKYDALLMPEFLGSLYQDWQTLAITQTVDQTVDGSGDYAKVLGSQAGLAQAVGRSEDISVFCDEECLIVGLLVVTPRPVYTQLLPKHFLHRDLLDSYQPEFNHLGFQPIYNKEIAPYASYSNKNSNEVFGYQRPWYEYVSSYDSAKGLYRTQLSAFLMQRTFLGVPQLSQDFLLVNPADVNDVFTVTDVSDKIFGQIAFDVSAKLPIARLAVPRLD